MKRRKMFRKNDIANQTIETILLYLDDQISKKEFDRFNSRMKSTFKPQMTMDLDGHLMAKQCS